MSCTEVVAVVEQGSALLFPHPRRLPLPHQHTPPYRRSYGPAPQDTHPVHGAAGPGHTCPSHAADRRTGPGGLSPASGDHRVPFATLREPAVPPARLHRRPVRPGPALALELRQQPPSGPARARTGPGPTAAAPDVCRGPFGGGARTSAQDVRAPGSGGRPGASASVRTLQCTPSRGEGGAAPTVHQRMGVPATSGGRGDVLCLSPRRKVCVAGAGTGSTRGMALDIGGPRYPPAVVEHPLTPGGTKGPCADCRPQGIA